jgi:hexosaminidase
MKKHITGKVILPIFLLTSIISLTAQTKANDNKYPLIPYPTSIEAGVGTFNITEKSTIVSSGKRFDNEVEQLNLLLKQYLGKPLKRNDKVTGSKSIVFKYDPGITAPEGYKLNVTTNSIVLSASQSTGIFRGVETIRQLLPASENSKKVVPTLTIPALSISDQPAFEWRGMHLDVSRHFFSSDYLKKFIDLLALYKFNKLHLHLTDDQGWRIEIKKYPKLTEEGGWRTFNNQDSACLVRAKTNSDFIIDPKHIIQKDGKTLYGGFYTQEEMKSVVAYALARHIDIIPEIDMPGHMMAAITSYPFLTANGENKWGKFFTTPICPCKETTFEFAQNVFTEIMDIFPSKYIHIGGDEVDRRSWEQADGCKILMGKLNIQTTGELQSYFINRMEKFFNSKGRKLIGWDEILEDGISSTAMVMYWRTWVPDAPIKAARTGNKVVMSPGNPLYFDNDPDRNSLSEVYHFNPIPAKLTAVEAQGIIGAQANTWSEKIPTESRADYMVFPRMTALAELLWTKKDDYKSYLQRLKMHYPRLDALNVSYRLPDIDGLIERNIFVNSVVLNPQKPLSNLTLRYTTDGSLPEKNSTVLDGPLVINKNCEIRVAAFTEVGRRGDVNDLHYNQQTLAISEQVINVADGLTCNFFPGEFKNVKSIAGVAKSVATVNSIKVPKEFEVPSFGLKFHGFLDVPEDGIYSFYLNCDDGGILRIANREVIDNDGPHGPFEKSGQVAIRKGFQSFSLDFMEGGGGYTLKLLYSINDSQPKEIPTSWFKH